MLAKNQRTPLGELDLVCRSSSQIVIVEVKARSGEEYGTGLEAIGPRKARRLRAAAMWWLSEQGIAPVLSAIRRGGRRPGRLRPAVQPGARQGHLWRGRRMIVGEGRG